VSEKSDAKWMEKMVQDLAMNGNGARDDPELLAIASRLRAGQSSEIEVQHLKRAAIAYTEGPLVKRPAIEQSTFLIFLAHSELVDHSSEIRKALYAVIEPQLEKTPDKFTLEVASILLRSKTPPAESLIARLLREIRSEHHKLPDWRYMGLLAAMVGGIHGYEYTTSEFIGDIGLLTDQADFEESLHARDAIWRAMNPPMDSISIFMQVRSRQHCASANYPKTPDYTESMLGARNAIFTS